MKDENNRGVILRKNLFNMKKITAKLLTAFIFTGALMALLLVAGCCCHKPIHVSSGPITVYAAPVTVSGTNSSCQFSYIGSVSYVTTNGLWGWKPITGVTHTAADGGGRTDTMVYYNGRSLDKGCGQTSVTVPTPAPSQYYRFVIFFPTNMPATNYPIILNGFTQ